MSIGITVSAVSITTASFALTGVSGDSIEMQIATRPDFAWCVCPIFPMPAASVADVAGLNQGTSYYVRARNGEGDAWTVQAFRTLDGTPQIDNTDGIIVLPAMIVRPEPLISIAAGSEYGGFQARNLLFDAPVAWESLSASDVHQLTFSMAPAPVDTIALLQTNLPEDASIKVRAAATAPGIASDGAAQFVANFTAPRASSALPGRPGYHALIDLGAQLAYQFWRIEVSASTPGHVFHAEHLIIGKNLRTRNHSIDKKETPINYGSSERSRSGVPDRVDGLKGRRIEFDLSNLTESEFERNYSQVWRDTGEPMLVVPNTKDGAWLHDRIAYGDFLPGSASWSGSIRFTRSFGVESII